MKPNFFLIGAARSGTTSLHKYLEAHPEIFMSEVKEINYFSNNRYWEKGINWYESHFKTATEKIRGEASTSYTNYPLIKDVPKRLFHYLPDAKFIYILRDPIDRFLSHYLHRIRRGVES
ncbi:MAG: sulfotransferase, partial [Thermodesulfobacteriota bacterium]|nr:sulfotransferase [Thermodesulfobacteriota bacterium]